VALLGTLLRNRRPAERNYAWNQTNLTAPDTLEITSRDFTDTSTLAPRHAGKRAGGENLSPHLVWSSPPAGTAELLLLIEDIDAPLGALPSTFSRSSTKPTSRPRTNYHPAHSPGRPPPRASPCCGQS
jgi:hypothetical protein